MKIALLHDYLIRFGGAEKVFLNLRKIFPKAEIYTLLYDKEKMGKYFPGEKIQTSFLQRFPKFWRKRQKYLLPFIPIAAETIDLRDFDLVISSSNSFIKGIITRPQTIHICYCHSPMNFSWDRYYKYIKEQKKGFLVGAAIKIIMHYIRMWDRAASNRVDYFIANSKTTARRIKKYYGREARVIYPPACIPIIMSEAKQSCGDNNKIAASQTPRNDTLLSLRAKRSNPGEESEIAASQTPHNDGGRDDGFFLIISQLTPYKRIDLAVEAFNKLGLPLVIIGEGPDYKRLKKIAHSNVKLLGWQPDKTTEEYLKNCRAFIFPGEDDFGIAPVEAMSFGKPVLAYRKGGATETVIEGVTGEFFDEPAVEVLADGVRRLLINLDRYSPLVIRKRAEKFSRERFETAIKEFVIRVVEENRRG
ncbi:MAG: glycosyltransferase [Patescibacteria group bacterium]|nr:glycosyltransferase [Patescibacteria group bacterium]